MTSVWYIGTADTRVLTIEEWSSAGITSDSNDEWSSANGWSIPDTSFTTEQLDWLDLQTAEFHHPAPDTERPWGSRALSGPIYAQLDQSGKVLLSQLPSGSGGGGTSTPVILRVSGGYIQWQYEGDPTWTNLISVTSWATAAQGLKADTAVQPGELDARINEILAGAPDALNTLNEIAASIASQPDFASTITAEFAKRLKVDVNTQGLSPTEKLNGLQNLGVSTVGAQVFSAVDQAAARLAIGAAAVSGAATDSTDLGAFAAGAFSTTNDGLILDPLGNEWRARGFHGTMPSFGDNGDNLIHAADAERWGINFFTLDVGVVSDPGLPTWYPTLAFPTTTTYQGVSMPTWKKHIFERIDAYRTIPGMVVNVVSRDSMQTQRIGGVEQAGSKGYLYLHDDIENFFVELVTRYKNDPYVWINPHVEPPFTGQKWLDMHNKVIDAVRAAGYVGPIILDPPVAGQDLGPEYAYIGGDFAAGYRWLDLVSGAGGALGNGINNKMGLINGVHWYGWSTFMRTVAAGIAYINLQKEAGYPVISGETGVQTVGPAIDAEGSQNNTAAHVAFDLANGGYLNGLSVWHGHLNDYYRLVQGSASFTGRFWDADSTFSNVTWVGQALLDLIGGTA